MTTDRGPVSFQFTEEMKGFVTFGETSFEAGYARGGELGSALRFRLTIRTENIDAFVESPQHQAEMTGEIVCERLGGRLAVDRGIFNLFVDTADRNSRTMLYRLHFRDSAGHPYTLSGHKKVQQNVGPDIWRDTTTLFTNFYRGHIEASEEPAAEIVAAGVLRIEPLDFAKQLTTMRAYGPSLQDRVSAFGKFGTLFFGSLWEVYSPSCMPSMDSVVREIPLYSTEGVSDAEITTHPFVTADRLSLSLTRFKRGACDDIVLLIHGLTTSSDMFIMPEHYNLVQYLLNHGFTDVWALDFRMSNHFPYNLTRHRFAMDDCARYDHPAAVAKIREVVGGQARIHVICHCLGSVSFMMSLFGKAVSGITSVISNSVSLTPRVPGWSRFKLSVLPFLLEYVLNIEYVNPQWRRQPGFTLSKAFATVLSWFHRECDVPECHMLSAMWGTGWPALYSHENLHDLTHRRGGDLYGGTSVHYYRHVRKMVAAGAAVKFAASDARYQSLPSNYLDWASEIETPVLFMTGQENNVFRDSNIVCHEHLQAIAPGRHELQVFPRYGHQDVFMGKAVHIDVFPRLLEFLRKHSSVASPDLNADGASRDREREMSGQTATGK